MNRVNRYISFELLFALLIIIAYFLPWLDMGLIKAVGWDIPKLQKTITKVTNLFSRNKSFIYQTYAIFGVPVLSAISMLLWVMLKKKASRFFLYLSSILGFVLSLYLYTALPKVGSGVYLLTGSTLLSIIYLVLSRKKKSNNNLSERDNSQPNPTTDLSQSGE
ncbi:MAG: hypothetical protein QM660_08210 [Dysgonomonas sp.]